MKKTEIKELIIPLSEYATVGEDAYLNEAVAELEMTHAKSENNLYPHRSVVILAPNGDVEGVLTYLDVLQALEPKYLEIGNISSLSRFGLSHEYLKSMVDTHNLFEEPLDHICQKASQLKVKDFIHPPSEAEFIDEGATLNELIHQFVVGHYPSILATRNGKVIGVLRLADVFHEISAQIQSCAI